MRESMMGASRMERWGCVAVACLGLWLSSVAEAAGRKTCEEDCEADVKECLDYCEENAGKAASLCRQPCNSIRKPCLEECKQPPPKSPPSPAPESRGGAK
ncbi:hypothetical protein HPC49_53635 [Pyxidicoccus fallax]|uniref:Lipoprotein n=1 Tax=Pyxidicoccus fallax TaxID=394095 RepID=A0A848LZE2_9BACT|nr:hypothetical protein [Pyxidicoccus fallax]NMO23588.1 hypothetical protein [Pyxidicoccus fallax]NPC87011.1 hypothetical protein [Pyxidicoccus fallax]